MNINNTFMKGSLCLVCGAASLAAGYFSDRLPSTSPANPSTSSSESIVNQPFSEREVSLIEARKATSSCEKIISEGDPEKAAEFIAYLDQLHLDDRRFLLDRLAEHFELDHEKLNNLVQALALEFFKRSPEESLSFLAYFARYPAVVDVERHLLTRFLEQDPAELKRLTIEHTKNRGLEIEPRMRQIAAIYANEQKENFTDLTSWLGGLDPSEDWDVYRSGYEAIAIHASPDQRESFLKSVMEQLTEVESLSHIPALLIATQAADDPKEAARNLTNLPSGPWKAEALNSFLIEAGNSNPEEGVQILSDPGFLDGFFQPNSSEEAPASVDFELGDLNPGEKDFFDSALEHLLSTAIVTEPELVLASAGSFFDPKLTEDYQRVAKRLMTDEEFQAEFSQARKAARSQ